MDRPAPFVARPGPPMSTETTLAILPRIVHPRTGLVASLRRARSAEETPAQVWSCVGSLAIRSGGAPAADAPQRSLGAGVSIHADVAKVRAVGEALQAYTLAGPDARGVELTWGEAAQARAPSSSFLPRGHAAPEAGPLRWTWATRVTTGEVTLLPEGCFSESGPLGVSAPHAIGQGSACATSAAEAAARALAEAIERDALMTFWLRRGPIRDVVPAAIEDAEFQLLRASVEALGLRVVLRDATSDVGLPVIVCFVVASPDRPPFCAMGTGANESAHEAARRALEEAIQMRMRYQGLVEDAGGAIPASPAFLWWGAPSERPWFLESGAPTPPRALPRAPAHERLVSLARAAEAAGGEVYVADLTPPDVASLGLSIVAAGVSGLLPKTTVPRLSEATSRRLAALGVPTRGPYVPLPCP